MRVKALTGKGLIALSWKHLSPPHDVAFESDGQQTMQVVFEPAWPGMIE